MTAVQKMQVRAEFIEKILFETHDDLGLILEAVENKESHEQIKELIEDMNIFRMFEGQETDE